MAATRTYYYTNYKYHGRKQQIQMNRSRAKESEEMKRLVRNYALLAYPKFSKWFVIYTDASRT